MTTLNLRLDEELNQAIETLASQRHQSKSEAARQLLRSSLTREKLRLAQEELAPQARASGWLSEEDVMQDIS